MTARDWRSIGLALMLVAAALPASADDRCGDADGNGTVSVGDGVQTLRAAAGLGSACTLARCDLDGGGTVSVSDGVNVLRAAAGLAVVLDCPGGGAPTCEAATATVSLVTPEPIAAATLVLAYPTNAVTLPGSGDAAAARVTILTEVPLLNDGEPKDVDDRVEFFLVTFDGVTSGPLLSVRFDCLERVPDARDFTCTLSDVVGVDGVTAIDGASCIAEIATE